MTNKKKWYLIDCTEFPVCVESCVLAAVQFPTATAAAADVSSICSFRLVLRCRPRLSSQLELLLLMLGNLLCEEIM